MYKLDLPLDQSRERAVDKRRSADTARKSRILNTRLRVMGLDLDALNKQVQEKKHRQDTEMQQDKAFDKLRKYHDDMLLQQDADESEKRAALLTDLTQYWATQEHDDSQDADIKCDLKGAFRISIPESELGPASMQIFQGEGIGEEQKKSERMKKTQRDLLEQMQDNERQLLRDKHRETLISKEMVRQDFGGVQLHGLEEECKKAARITLDNDNQALAAAQAEKMKEQQRREEMENLAEMFHTLTSDMMTDAAEKEVGGGRPPRLLSDRWKGMSPEQLSAIHRKRGEQRIERQRQRQAEKVQNAARELQLLKLWRGAEEEDRRAEELRREKRIQMDHYNKLLATEQHASQEFLNKKLYTNKPTEEFFSQFNSSYR
ncbi:RIB43A-like with coiled-coils protein 1 [Brachionichthys hirsutus]|uniref:RIB43A-like with coiled-coils protein 1 n=1 Tax=Brachionichthys hirsutus TaxID=412623 RepID=UPI0036045B90